MKKNTISILLVWLLCCASFVCAEEPAGMPGSTAFPNMDIAALDRMDESELTALIPDQVGLTIGCPRCSPDQFHVRYEWDPKRPNQVRCPNCRTIYPTAEYPMTGKQSVTNPVGKIHEYLYYKDARGRRFYFQAQIWVNVLNHLSGYMRVLNIRYEKAKTLPKKRQSARRIIRLLYRFAQVFPGYCPHHYSMLSTENPPSWWNPGNPPRRWAKLGHWLYYNDAPYNEIDAYVAIRDTVFLEELSRELGMDVKSTIETDFFHPIGKRVFDYGYDGFNMAPRAWAVMARIGRVLNQPDWVHEAVRRVQKMARERFMWDNVWPEACMSYHCQVVGLLNNEIGQTVAGYSDPTNYISPIDGKCFDDFDLGHTSLRYSADIVNEYKLPDGVPVPLGDTYYDGKKKTGKKAQPPLLARIFPAVGHVCLELGEAETSERSQVWMQFGGYIGHRHKDMLGILAFIGGEDIVPDFGYPFGALPEIYQWGISSLAHNTVVIDGQDQQAGGMEPGNVLALQASDCLQIVEVDAKGAYPKAREYRRRLLLIKPIDGSPYLVDVFTVSGGDVHDWFIHGKLGSRIREGTWNELNPLKESFAPDVPGVSKYYGYFKDIRTKSINPPYRITFCRERPRNAPKPLKEKFARDSLGTTNFSGQLKDITDLPTNGWEFISCSHLLGASAQLFVGYGRSPNCGAFQLEGARQEDLFPTVVLRRRRQPESRFVALHEAIASNGETRVAATIAATTNYTVLSFEGKTGKDIILSANIAGVDPQRCEWRIADFELPLIFQGQAGVISIATGRVERIALTAASFIRVGQLRFSMPAVQTADVVRVSRRVDGADHNALFTSTPVQLATGMFFIVEHKLAPGEDSRTMPGVRRIGVKAIGCQNWEKGTEIRINEGYTDFPFKSSDTIYVLNQAVISRDAGTGDWKIDANVEGKLEFDRASSSGPFLNFMSRILHHR